MSLTRSFAAFRIRFAGFRAAIAGAVLGGPNHEFPGSVIFMNHAAHRTNELVGAALRNAQNPRSVSNRGRPAVVDSDWVRHGLIISFRGWPRKIALDRTLRENASGAVEEALQGCVANSSKERGFSPFGTGSTCIAFAADE